MTFSADKTLLLLRRLLGTLGRYGTALLVLGAGMLVYYVIPGLSQTPGVGPLIWVMVILICSGLCGLGPALIITGLGSLIGIAPNQSDGQSLRNALFTLNGVTISLMVDSLKMARRRMKVQSETFSAILKASVDHIYVLDCEGRYLYVSKGAANVLGRDSEGMIGQTWRNLGLSPKIMEPFHLLFDSVLASKKSVTGEIEYECGEGLQSFEYTMAPIDRNGTSLMDVIVVSREITERKRAEAAHSQLAAIVDSSYDAIVSKSIDGVIASWNGGAVRLFGYSAEEALGRSIDFLIPLERRSEEPSILERLRQGLRVEHFESVRLAKDGRLIDVSLTISPIRDATGRIIGASKIARDITERKRAEEASARLAAIVESSDDSIMSEDLDGTIVTWNEGARRIFGYTHDDVIGRPIAEILISVGHPNEPQELLEAVKRGEPVRNFEAQRLRKDGSIVDLSVTVSLIRDRSGNVIGVSRIHRDITERRQTEAQIHHRERELADFFENATVGLHWMNADGIILRTNRAELAILGYDSEEYIGRHIAEFHVEREVIDDVLRRMQAGETIRDQPARLLHKDGSTRDVLIDSIVRWEDGQFIHTRSFTRDVTERNRAELARRESDRTARSVLDSLSSNIAVLDENGTILAVNRSWIEFAEQNQKTSFCSEGTNYLSVCEGIGVEPDASRFAKGIRDVLAGRQGFYSLEYACHSPNQKRWFLGRVLPFLGDGPRRAVVIHLDVTERKLADEALRNYADRLENLRAIDLAILSAQSTAEIAGSTLKHLARLMPCWLGEVALYDLDRKTIQTLASMGVLERWHPPGTRFTHSMDGHAELEALRRGNTVVEEDIKEMDLTSPVLLQLRDKGLRSYILIPLMFQGQLTGSIFMGSETPGAFRAEHIEIAHEVADHLAIAIRQALLLDNVRLAQARMEALSRQLLRAQEDERRRIARELHDEVGQGLTAAKIAVDRIAVMPAVAIVHARLSDVSSLIGGTLDQVRDLSRLLRPSILDDLGLEEALRALAEGMTERTGITIDVDSSGEIGWIDPELESVCYRIAQEALNNAVKHAQATRLQVELRRVEGELELVIVDDGVGFDLDAATARASLGASLGLLSLSERATLAGGSTRIKTRPREGTQVSARFPVPSPSSRNCLEKD